jgi:hypothetical protein
MPLRRDRIASRLFELLLSNVVTIYVLCVVSVLCVGVTHYKMYPCYLRYDMVVISSRKDNLSRAPHDNFTLVSPIDAYMT